MRPNEPGVSLMSDEGLFDIGELRALVAVGEEGGFGSAAVRLGLTQSAVSQQVRRLEDRLGRTLFRRTAAGAVPTADGEAMLAYARAMLDVAARTQAHFAGPAPARPVRFGLVEDFALVGLTSILAALWRQYPQLQLFTQVGMCDDLFGALDAGLLDVVLAKRPLGSSRGVPLWREGLAWVGLPDVLDAAQGRALPLVLYPPGTASRSLVEKVLRNAGQAWTVVFESASIASLRAAVQAGVGLSAFGRDLLPEGLALLDHGDRLPALGPVEYVLERRPGIGELADAVAELLREAAVMAVADRARAGQSDAR